MPFLRFFHTCTFPSLSASFTPSAADKTPIPAPKSPLLSAETPLTLHYFNLAASLRARARRAQGKETGVLFVYVAQNEYFCIENTLG